MDNLIRDILLTDPTKRILEGLDEGIYVTDRDRKVVFWNQGAERITGFAPSEVVGKSCADNILCHIDGEGNDLCNGNCPLLKVLNWGKEETVYVFLRHKKGHRIPVKVKVMPIYDDNRSVIGVVEIFSDTSEVHLARRKIDLLRKELYNDSLTGIGNRRFCDMELDHRFEELANHGTPFAAALCDIDDFKRINDNYGHNKGDMVLQMVARTLSDTLRSMDVVGRWGGEEFLLIFALPDDESVLLEVTERSRHLIEGSFLMSEGKKISVTASFGVSAAKATDSVETLFKRIDELLYKSKREGKNRVSLG
ncbi:MAG: sensor domain-containing diguanylate cyclase [Spirochaetales bacterium]|nr:sensor domain-containing diguanylate cyclase [Spirochaetales bacterium]